MTAVLVRRGNLVRLAAGPVALAVSLGALAVARGPGRFTTYAGGSGLTAALTIATGLGLVAAGLVTAFSRPAGRIGDLAVLAGLVWFAPVWVGWDKGPPLVRSLGMLAAGFAFPLLLHLVLAFPGGQPRGAITRALILTVYLEAALAAIGLALFRKPFFRPRLLGQLQRQPVPRRLAPASRAPDRGGGPVVHRGRRGRPGGRLRLAAAAGLWASTPHAVAGRPASDPARGRRHRARGRAAANAARGPLPAGLPHDLRRRMRRGAPTRRRTGVGHGPHAAPAPRRRPDHRELGPGTPPGSLQAALTQAVGDPELRIAYWLPDAEHYVDAEGRPVAEPTAAPGRAVTILVRDDRRMAVVSHTAALPDLERELGAAVRLALENERLQAEALAQLDQLRDSRVRIVETGDSERRRLERDLHDGAQQQLLALSYDLRLARANAQADGDSQTGSLLTQATDQAQAALRELRDLAHGIYPAVLAEAGLVPALATLADTAPLPVEILAEAEGRYPAVVETCAYLLVAEALDDAAGRDASHTTVSVVQDGGRLVVTVDDDGTDRTATMVQLADRVGAPDGGLAVEPTRLRAELPCG